MTVHIRYACPVCLALLAAQAAVTNARVFTLLGGAENTPY